MGWFDKPKRGGNTGGPIAPEEKLPRAMRVPAEEKRTSPKHEGWSARERKRLLIEADWLGTLEELERALRGVRRPYILGPLADYKALHRRLLGFLADGDNVIADIRQWLDGDPIPEGRQIALVVDNTPRKKMKRVRLLPSKPKRVRLHDDDDPHEAA